MNPEFKQWLTQQKYYKWWGEVRYWSVENRNNYITYTWSEMIEHSK